MAVAGALAVGGAGCAQTSIAVGAGTVVAGGAMFYAAQDCQGLPCLVTVPLAMGLGIGLVGLGIGMVATGSALIATQTRSEEAAAADALRLPVRGGAPPGQTAPIPDAGADAAAVDPDPTVAQMVMAARAGRCVEAAERARRLATRTPTRLARVIDRDDAVARCLRDGGYKM